MLTLAINYKVINAIALHCKFEMVWHFPSIEIYSCSATILIETQANQDVTSVFGTHLPGKGNEDVASLGINSQNLQFFPTKIEEFLPNIEVINFYNNSISSVSNANLSPFPKLWSLVLGKNRISVLDRNLFFGLSSLREIRLSENGITSIDSHLFAGLRAEIFVDLSSNNIRHVGHDLVVPDKSDIWLTYNSCVDEALYAYDDEVVNEFRYKLLMNCPPTISLIESTLEIRQNFIQNLMDRVAALERIIESTNALKANG